MSNLDAKRNRGDAKGDVEMHWLIQQQDKPEDYGIANGMQHCARDLAHAVAKKLGATVP